jgi:pimeloyl-ACP methyl ester carboxylesterase
MTQMAVDAIAFLDAMGLVKPDILGFSIGSFVAQELALVRPALVRRLALASSAPPGAAGMHGWAPEVIGAVGAHTQPRWVPQRLLHALERKPAIGHGDSGKADRTEQRSRRADDLADATRAIRRGLRLGDPGSQSVATGRRHRHARVRRQRRQRPDDPAALLVSASWPDPASAGEGLPRLGPRVLVPAPGL